MRLCPQCGAETMGAMYLGLPGWICLAPEHRPPIAGGPAIWLGHQLEGYGVIGPVIAYRRGDYWRTLFAWLLGEFG